MKTRSRALLLSALLLLPAGGLLLLMADGSGAQPGSDPGAAGPVRPEDLPSEGALAPFQADLLDLAFRAASALPLDPHRKTRSKEQEAVVAACLELDQPRRALRYLEGIEDWRRGAAYADLAFHCARRGETRAVERCLDLAGRIAEEQERDENAQEWRRDRIRAKIARTLVWSGEARRAEPFEANLVDSERGEVDAVRAMRLEAADFDGQVRALDEVVATGSFDRIQDALATYARLFDRFYEDGDRRARIEEKFEASCRRLPALVQVESRMELASVALEHGDRNKARERVEDARRLVESGKWLPEQELSIRARLVGLRHRAGDEKGARQEAASIVATFDASREKIVDIYRAGALRPLGEAYQAMGDASAARAVYRKALEEGVHNPNSRPRAEDLSATCRSMALRGVEPGADLRARMLQILDGLGPPW